MRLVCWPCAGDAQAMRRLVFGSHILALAICLAVRWRFAGDLLAMCWRCAGHVRAALAMGLRPSAGVAQG